MKNRVPLTGTQRLILFDSRISQDQARFNIGGYARIKGDLDVPLLQVCIKELLSENDVFQFVIQEVDGEPFMQFVSRQFEVSFVDLTSEPWKVLELIDRNIDIPLDPDRGVFVYTSIVKVAPTEFIWFIKIHHLLVDGYAFRLVFKKVSEKYNQKLEGRKPGDEIFSYRDFISKEILYRQSPAFSADAEYWTSKFADFPDVIFSERLTADENRRNNSQRLVIERSKYNALLAAAERSNSTIFHVFLTALFISLNRCFGRKDIAIAIPVLNRSGFRFKETIGLFMNLMPIRHCIDSRRTVAETITSIRKELRDCYKHEKFQLSEMIAELRKINRKVDRLHDLRFSFEPFSYDGEFSKCRSEIVAVTHSEEVDPISVYVREYSRDEGVVIDIKFNNEYLNPAAQVKFVETFGKVIDELPRELNNVIANWNLYPADEVLEILQRHSQGIVRERSGNFIDALRTAAANYPDRVALICGAQSITYRELWRQSNAVANRIIASAGRRKGVMIPLLMDRGLEMIVSMIGVHKAGAAYIPLDPELPEKRIRFIYDDANSPFIITDKAHDHVRNIGCHTMCVEDYQHDDSEPGIAISENDTAYLIYTSGSTGTPKGVRISHLSLVDYALTFAEYFGITPHDCVCQQASIGFDASVEEIFPALTKGASVLVVAENKDFSQTLEVIEKHGATILSTNPFLIDFINRSTWFPASLRLLISGGDVLKPDYLSNIPDDIEVYNTYGPTESTVCASYYRVTRPLPDVIPIGSPIVNRNIYIVDEQLRHLPFGMEGEMCITGAGISQGYLNNDEATKHRFIPCPFETNTNMFRTGDLARFNSKGEIEFAGRKDRQVKLNGYRIELEEIENVLLKLPAVKQAKSVIAGNDPYKRLVAYIVPADEMPSKESLSQQCSLYMPSHMIPDEFMALDSFPLTANGKIDVSKLPEVPAKLVVRNSVLPRNEKEKAIARIWSKLLALDEIGVDDNFFELGGNSIRANSFIARLKSETGIEMSLKDFFKDPVISEIALREPKHPVGKTTLQKAPRNGKLPVTFEQERLWFLGKLNPKNNSYIVPRAIRAKGDLRIDVVEAALTAMCDRHEILRTQFVDENGSLVQKILPSRQLKATMLDFTNLSPDEQLHKAKDLVMSEGNRPFNLQTEPLQRLTHIKLGEQDAMLIWCQHHLIHDGWTQGVLLNEFINNYTSLLNGGKPESEPLSFQYADYAYWQRTHFSSAVNDEHIVYWKSKLAGVEPLIDLPLDKPRPKILTGNGGIERLVLPPELADAMRAFSKSNDLTLYMSMLAAFKILLYKFSGLTDICIAGWFANRRLSEIENMIGMIINTLPLRTQLNHSDSILTCMQKVKETLIEAMDHQDTPFDRIVDAIQPPRDLSHLPLVQVGFAFMDTPTRRLQLPRVELEVEQVHNNSAKLDIGVIVITPREQIQATDIDHDITIEMEYNSDIFERSTITRLLTWYEKILRHCLSKPNDPIDQVSMIDTGVRRMLTEFKGTEIDFNIDVSIHRAFERNVANTPEAVCCRFRGINFSYTTINKQANQLAQRLLDEGLTKGDAIGILLGRSEQIIVSLLAVMKAGCVFVPLDRAMPLKRIDFIASDSSMKGLITDYDVEKHATDMIVINPLTGNGRKYVGENLEYAGDVNEYLYIMYTSGSSGTPKGVKIRSRSLINQFMAISRQVGVTATNFLASTTITFDPSLIELIMPLMTGGRIVITENSHLLDIGSLKRLIEDEQPDFMQGTPTFWRNLVDRGWRGDKRLSIFCGGEVLTEDLAAGLVTRCGKLFNVYGPTETTVWSTYQQVTQPSHCKRIGRPLANVKVWILDAAQRQQPVGIRGEIYISGAGLADEYLNNDKLTASRFLDNAFEPGTKYYRTGDSGRWCEDGSIEFSGRVDLQLKIRGHRIEPGEIESIMLRYPGMEQVVVAGQFDNSGEKVLCAYFCSDIEPVISELKLFLREYLPEPMVPAYFVRMESIPLTSSSKVDRRSLPPLNQDIFRREKLRRPESKLEIQLEEIWKQVLQRDDIDIDGTFFELGGSSLKLISLYNKVCEAFPERIQVHHLFMYPSVSALSGFLEGNEKHKKQEINFIEL